MLPAAARRRSQDVSPAPRAEPPSGAAPARAAPRRAELPAGRPGAEPRGFGGSAPIVHVHLPTQPRESGLRCPQGSLAPSRGGLGAAPPMSHVHLLRVAREAAPRRAELTAGRPGAEPRGFGGSAPNIPCTSSNTATRTGPRAQQNRVTSPWTPLAPNFRSSTSRTTPRQNPSNPSFGREL